MQMNELMGIVFNPITHSLYSANNSIVGSPGSPEFIVTEDEIKITTEDDIFLITEG